MMTDGGALLESAERDELEIVESMIAAFGAADRNELQAVLEELIRGVGAAGGAISEWASGSVPRIINAVGRLCRMGEDPEVQAFFRKQRFELSARNPLGTGVVDSRSIRYGLATLRLPNDRFLSAVIARDDGGEAPAPSLLRILLQLAANATTDEDTPRPRATSPSSDFVPGYIPGRSAAMTALYKQLSLVAAANLPVLIAGETGVGKEHIAQIIHRWSRRPGPFAVVNCAAIPADLFEAEMFGIGASVASGVAARAGNFQLAARGTLFLDEIGEMPPALQAKLLRAVQEKQIHPVGAPPYTPDVRIVAASNADLGTLMQEGRFRSDLYYRLAGCVAHVPPLRHRVEDVPLFIDHYLQRFSREAGRAGLRVSVRAYRALTAYSWPGNVRELEHEICRLVYLSHDGATIDEAMLSPAIRVRRPHRRAEADDLDLRRRLQELERSLVLEALERTNGNRTRAAALLGLSRNGLALKLERIAND